MMRALWVKEENELLWLGESERPHGGGLWPRRLDKVSKKMVALWEVRDGCQVLLVVSMK